MPDTIEKAVNDYFEIGIRNLAFQIGNLNGRLNRLMESLRTKDLNEDQEAALVGMASECSLEIHSYSTMLDIEKKRFSIIKTTRKEIERLESETIYYNPESDD